MNKTTLILIVIVVGALLVFGMIESNLNVVSEENREEIIEDNTEFTEDSLPTPIQAEFLNKIVYTSDMGLDETPFVEHCALIGGEFNSCGSVCRTDTEVCVAVCAYTCELEDLTEEDLISY